MQINDRSLNIRYVRTDFLPHAAEEGLHQYDSAAWPHGAPTVCENAYAVCVIPVMEDEAQQIQVALRDGVEEISRHPGAPCSKPQRHRGRLRPRHVFGPVVDDAMQLRIALHQAVEQRTSGAADIHGQEAL